MIAADILEKDLDPAGNAVSETVTSIVPEGTDEIVIPVSSARGFPAVGYVIGGLCSAGKTARRNWSVQPSRASPHTVSSIRWLPNGTTRNRRQCKISEYATQRQAWAAMMRGEADVLHDVSVESLRLRPGGVDRPDLLVREGVLSRARVQSHAATFRPKGRTASIEHGGRPLAGRQYQPQKARHTFRRTRSGRIISAAPAIGPPTSSTPRARRHC